MTAEITAAIAVAIAAGTLIREWVKDRSSTGRAERNDAAAWYQRWQESEAARTREADAFRLREAEWLADLVKREQRWEQKCTELAAQIALLQSEIERLKER